MLIFCSWNLLHEDFLLVQLEIDFSPLETDFANGTCCLLIFILRTCCVVIFVCETRCMLIFLFAKLVNWFISSWNWFRSRNLLHEDFVCRFCCLLIFVREACILVFVFVKLINWSFSSWNLFYSWILLRVDFYSWNLLRADFCSWNLFDFSFRFNLYIDSSPRETGFQELVLCWFLLVKLVVRWFLFVKLFTRWFLSSWNFYIDFSHRETYFVHGICDVLNFIQGSWCALIFFR